MKAKERLYLTLQGGSVDQNKTELIPVPLPTEIPEPPSLENLPLDVLHSATVEMLIQQNDDLSSRLKVNIRRNSQQEQKILEIKNELNQMERINESLRAQNEIVKEKENIWMRQKEEQARKLETSSKEMDLMELRYNELYTTTKQKQKELHKQIIDKNNIIEALQRKIHIFNSVRIKAKDRLRHFLLQAAQSLHQDRSASTKTMSQNRLLKKQFESLSLDVSQKEEAFREQLETVKDVSQKKINELGQTLVELKESLSLKEASIKDLQKDITRLEHELTEEKKGRARISALSRELGENKNEKLSDKRKYLEIIKKLEEARQLEKEKMDILETQKGQATRTVESQKEAIEACETKILELRNDNQDLSVQLSKIQELWMDSQDKLEKAELKRKTLEKINRELSREEKSQKVQKAIERSHEVQTPESQTDRDINNKITEVYATQYSSMNRSPEL